MFNVQRITKQTMLDIRLMWNFAGLYLPEFAQRDFFEFDKCLFRLIKISLTCQTCSYSKSYLNCLTVNSQNVVTAIHYLFIKRLYNLYNVSDYTADQPEYDDLIKSKLTLVNNSCLYYVYFCQIYLSTKIMQSLLSLTLH